MSWFDTTKLASIANKAMKEAQKTLDSALDIAEEQAEEDRSSALWSAWKKSESQPQITGEENSVEISNSHSSPSLNNEPVSMQPKRVIVEKEVTPFQPILYNPSH